ncbi:hypothetical protein [Bacillus toyonensis]|uniref:hypothetical protein n=1 Tax=Bacillus toyonensis TaxID=155322 RepID=UPI002E237AD0|nr:hypothetical protein [Bacillus toyonensis]
MEDQLNERMNTGNAKSSSNKASKSVAVQKRKKKITSSSRKGANKNNKISSQKGESRFFFLIRRGLIFLAGFFLIYLCFESVEDNYRVAFDYLFRTDAGIIITTLLLLVYSSLWLYIGFKIGERRS